MGGATRAADPSRLAGLVLAKACTAHNDRKKPTNKPQQDS